MGELSGEQTRYILISTILYLPPLKGLYLSCAVSKFLTSISFFLALVKKDPNIYRHIVRRFSDKKIVFSEILKQCRQGTLLHAEDDKSSSFKDFSTV